MKSSHDKGSEMIVTLLSRGHQSYLAEILQVSGALVVGETATGNLNMPYCHNNEGVLAQGQNLAAAEPQQKRRFFSYLSLVSPSQEFVDVATCYYKQQKLLLTEAKNAVE